MSSSPTELFRSRAEPGAAGTAGPFFLIAGPCVLEDDALNLQVGEALARLADELGLPIVYKASFDKANRSRADAARGPGLERGLEQLARVRSYALLVQEYASMRGPVDVFFDKVLVMDTDDALRENRLRLLNRFVALFERFADLRQIAG